MSARPNFRFHRDPRFSANQLAEYMQANTARQRETVIRAAKFPRTTAVVAYTASRNIISDFLPSHEDGFASFDQQIQRLHTKLRREPDGWNQDEIKRNIEALSAFKTTFAKRRLKRLEFTTGPVDLTMSLRGVRINTRLDAGIVEYDDDGAAFGGGIVLFLASGAASRKNIPEKAPILAETLQRHWPQSLQDACSYRCGFQAARSSPPTPEIRNSGTLGTHRNRSHRTTPGT